MVRSSKLLSSGVTTPESGLQDGGRPRSQQPPETSERRAAGWQRALRWVAWLGFLGLAIWKSQSVSFSGLEFLALAVAIGISIFYVAKPLGGRRWTCPSLRTCSAASYHARIGRWS